MTVVSMCHISSARVVRRPTFGLAGCTRSRGRRQPNFRTRWYQVEGDAEDVGQAGVGAGHARNYGIFEHLRLRPWSKPLDTVLGCRRRYVGPRGPSPGVLRVGNLNRLEVVCRLSMFDLNGSRPSTIA